MCGILVQGVLPFDSRGFAEDAIGFWTLGLVSPDLGCQASSTGRQPTRYPPSSKSVSTDQGPWTPFLREESPVILHGAMVGIGRFLGCLLHIYIIYVHNTLFSFVYYMMCIYICMSCNYVYTQRVHIPLVGFERVGGHSVRPLQHVAWRGGGGLCFEQLLLGLHVDSAARGCPDSEHVPWS